jgi:23S rRNA pseudouridine2604 synthase
VRNRNASAATTRAEGARNPARNPPPAENPYQNWSKGSSQAKPGGTGSAGGTGNNPGTIANRPAAAATPAKPAAGPNDQVRLSKRMSELGMCSRREADEWIERGWVRVDGKVVDVLGTKVFPYQRVSVERQAAAEQSKRVTILLHKPVGYVSGQAEDGHQPAFTLISPETRWDQDKLEEHFHPTHLRHLVPAGRLDIDSVGLLVLTQDGRVAKQLIGEQSDIEKEYLVRVQYTRPGKLPEQDLRLLCHGLELDGKKLLPAQVRWQNDDQLRFVLKEGKKRQIRRMCELVGLKVLGLKRVRIGRVALGDLPPGQWRYLRPDEAF